MPTPGEAIRSAKLVFTTQDVLYSKLRPYLNKVHLPTFEGISATDLLPLRPRQGISREYVAFYLRTPHVVEYAKQRMRGIQLPRLTVGDLLALTIPVAPTEEQLRIVSRINELIARLHSARQALQRVPAIMKRFRQSTLSEIFNRRTETANSNGWKVVRVKEIAEVRLGKQRSPRNRAGKYARKYLRVANVFKDKLDFSDIKEMDFPPSEFERYKLRKGDVLLCEGQSPELVGRCAVWDEEIRDCCFQNTLIRVRSDSVPSRYLLHVFEHAADKGDFAELATQGVNIAHLGATRLAEYRIPLASDADQSRIVQQIDQDFDYASEVESRASEAEDIALALERSILDEAFRGRLVAQDSHDEPASKLLTRIENQTRADYSITSGAR